MTYFQGGDFVELLSAQGQSPAAAWKLQGKISKTYDKSIKGNAFQLDGNSETKMQLPKKMSTSLRLAQRFVVLQLLVPFTRSFSVEICFSDFRKVRRRFIVASAFRDIARTSLHVQLPLNAAKVPRDQWQNLVFDLQVLSETYFSETGYHSMESLCVSGSCRLKRIFTMKSAPPPSDFHFVRYADTQNIPRQFEFSTTQRGAKGGIPIPTLYFSMESSGSSSGDPKSRHQSQTAPLKAQIKASAREAQTVRPVSSQAAVSKIPSTGELKTNVNNLTDPTCHYMHQPAQDGATRRKLCSSKSRVDKQVKKVQQRHVPVPEQRHVPVPEVGATTRHAFEEIVDNDKLGSLSSPFHCDKQLLSQNKEITRLADSPRRTEDEFNDTNGASSSAATSSSREEQPSQTLRSSILGEIQQTLASLKHEDEQADERDRKLFLRHTSLHTGKWYDKEDLADDEILLSDGGDSNLQLRLSWSRKASESIATSSNVALEPEQRQDHEVSVQSPEASRSKTNLDSIFSFSSIKKPTDDLGSVSRLFDLDSLLQDVKEVTPADHNEANDVRESEGVVDSDSGSEDQELTKLLKAKRVARENLLRTQTIEGKRVVKETSPQSATDEKEENKVKDETQRLSLPCGGDNSISKREEWLLIDKDREDAMDDTKPVVEHLYEETQDENLRLSQRSEQEDDLQMDLVDEINGLSIDLTSELSVSRGEAHHIEDMSSWKGPRCSGAETYTPRSLDDKSPLHSDSSFEFEGLLEDAESSEDSDEDVKTSGPTQLTVSLNTKSCQFKPAMTAPRSLEFLPSTTRKSSHGKELTQKSHNASLRTARSDGTLRQTHSPPSNGLRKSHQRPPECSNLSCSFSTNRLQKLLESTDWTAELTAQAASLNVNHQTVENCNRRQRFAPHRSTTDLQHSEANECPRRSSKSVSSRIQTPSSTSSLDLVYDPRLRCYYDPVANKYYALAS